MTAAIQAVSHARHGQSRWRRFADYRFAAQANSAPLAAAEIGSAALASPLAFVRDDEHWSLHALLGFLPGQNLCVDGRGAWLTRYVPYAFRTHPFLLGARADGEPTLCVDCASGVVSEGGEGEPFYDEHGALNETVAQVSKFLLDNANSQAVIMQVCEALANAGLLEVWPLTLQSDASVQQVDGLYRVSEAKLNSLDDATFTVLRRAGALPVIYGQLLSMNNMAQLAQLGQARAQAEAAERARAAVKPMVNLPTDSTIDWDWSKIGR